MTRPPLSRRRFLTITAAVAGGLALPSSVPAASIPLHQWRGVALGAGASIILRHPEAERIVTQCRAEITRLEGIFSLYRADSALSRLNAEGRLTAPPFELLESLSLCGRVHGASGGLFDPTIQPLWALYAEHHAQGRIPPPEALTPALTPALGRVGWEKVSLSPQEIRLEDGMALSLNGIAQGAIADRVAALLEAEGLTDILVNTGEFHALGGHPDGGDWPIHLAGEDEAPPLLLRNRSLASSAPLGTVFDRQGQVGHILHPKTGQPAPPRWRLVTLTAPSAALADALSTACCLMERAEITALLQAFPEARLAFLS